jgi:hypothetical protein
MVPLSHVLAFAAVVSGLVMIGLGISVAVTGRKD